MIEHFFILNNIVVFLNTKSFYKVIDEMKIVSFKKLADIKLRKISHL